MNEITPHALRRQVAHLGRCMADAAFRMFIAQLDNDTEEYERQEIEYQRIERLRDRLAAELRQLISLRNEQARAVAEVERILEIGH